MDRTNDHDAGTLDFWGFVDLAAAELHRRYGDDEGTTRALLMLNRASGAVTYDLESTALRPRGRSWATFRVLYVLWLAGPQEPARLAELAGQTRQGISNLAGSLVAEGLVERRPSACDRRRAVLLLTDAGTAEIEALYAAQHEREKRWMAALEPDERGELVRLLGKLAGHRDFAATRHCPPPGPGARRGGEAPARQPGQEV